MHQQLRILFNQKLKKFPYKIQLFQNWTKVGFLKRKTGMKVIFFIFPLDPEALPFEKTNK